MTATDHYLVTVAFNKDNRPNGWQPGDQLAFNQRMRYFVVESVAEMDTDTLFLQTKHRCFMVAIGWVLALAQRGGEDARGVGWAPTQRGLRFGDVLRVRRQYTMETRFFTLTRDCGWTPLLLTQEFDAAWSKAVVGALA